MSGQDANRLQKQTIQEEMQGLGEFDLKFLLFLKDLGKHAMTDARQCTEAVFELSSNYVDKPAFEALRRFYDLYFGVEHIEAQKQKVHQDVEDLVSILQEKIRRGEAVDEEAVDDRSRVERLGLAGVQKQLEGLITLDEGIRTQILPALASMQFEDAVTQRMDHLTSQWALYAVQFESGGDFTADFDATARQAADICTSVEETKDFYEIVLHEQAPEGEDQRSIFLEF